LPDYASELQGRIAFAWHAIDSFYEEEDERIGDHAPESYHRIDIRQTSRRIMVRHNRIIADSKRPLALYESGFAPRWYVPRADVDVQTFCVVVSSAVSRGWTNL